MNVVLLQGTLSSEPRVQTLESGSLLMRWELTTRGDEERRLTVPVVWFDPPQSVRGFDAGEEVVVLGQVRRRFFQTGGGVQSTTEVVAERGTRARRAKTRLSVVNACLDRVGEIAA